MRRFDKSGMFMVAAWAALVSLVCSPGLMAEWKIESADGDTSIKFGFLMQARGEIQDQIDGDGTSQDLYFRRLRILFGGNISKKWSFFFETDSPNLGKGTPSGDKIAADIYIQDFFVTYNHSNAFKVDVGAILIPLSHNSQQSAATLLPADYAAFSFLNSGPTDSRVGRDYGVQLRGFLANDHFEYRAGVYQGERGETSENEFRYVGRVVFYPFEADKGFYYAGTTLGKKQILALGAGIDHQESYDAYSLDMFYDQPVGNGNGLTLQLGGIRYDGGEIFPELSIKDVLMGEAGFYWDRFKVQPFVTYYALDRDEEDLDDQSRFGVGLGYYLKGFNRNLKFSYTDIRTDNQPSRSQWLLQLQIFMF